MVKIKEILLGMIQKERQKTREFNHRLQLMSPYTIIAPFVTVLLLLFVSILLVVYREINTGHHHHPYACWK